MRQGPLPFRLDGHQAGSRGDGRALNELDFVGCDVDKPDLPAGAGHDGDLQSVQRRQLLVIESSPSRSPGAPA